MFYKQTFLPEEYDKGIAATLPYYGEYFKQIADIVTIVFQTPVTWLDIGCGTGKMLEAEGIHKVVLVAFEKNVSGNAFWEKVGFTVRDDLVYRNKNIHQLKRIDLI